MPAISDPAVLDALRRYWGYDALRPMQAEAIDAELEGRDSLVVLPTGGGKSLCYQIPPAVAERTDIVVSPLISLMKDQVDGLRACGYPATALHSGVPFAEQREIERDLRDGAYQLVFVSPERLLTNAFMLLLRDLNLGAFAIDEAHCISQWGHDFRPEYRQLRVLRQRFPDAAIHAYTATATERVRNDILLQLGLHDPAVLVGDFDRPNLVYRVVPRVDLAGHVIEILRRHPREAAIVYCISRRDTETLANTLTANGIVAAAYHAGLAPAPRQKVQDDFAAELVDVVVATVAFGMGIDRSNVRCVIHAAMPKSVEHFQQETGRAGRDGLEAECVLLYSPADAMRWESLVQRSAAESDDPAAAAAPQLELLAQMRHLASTVGCRHRMIVEHFGQSYAKDNCGACDVCLGEAEGLIDVTVEAQKILSCVYRLEQRFGVTHVVAVLAGADTDAVRRWNHDALSTHGIMADTPRKEITRLVHELVGQGMLDRTPGDMPVLVLNERSVEVLKGDRTIQVQRRPTRRGRTKATIETEGWTGVDRGLFDRLRDLRTRLARERNVPPYVIFNDVTLRGLAALRPTTFETMIRVKGIGRKKLDDFGETFIDAISSYCSEHGVAVDIEG
ncbi:MAG: DNA helicase RecQ [Phycisphaerales bacterium]|nr:DNA helicase RecQ [Phycisphaerales bacterium]